jgi:hypothetical protein
MHKPKPRPPQGPSGVSRPPTDFDG